nr:hypothetical protein [Dipteran tombus-related virus]
MTTRITVIQKRTVEKGTAMPAIHKSSIKVQTTPTDNENDLINLKLKTLKTKVDIDETKHKKFRTEVQIENYHTIRENFEEEAVRHILTMFAFHKRTIPTYCAITTEMRNFCHRYDVTRPSTIDYMTDKALVRFSEPSSIEKYYINKTRTEKKESYIGHVKVCVDKDNWIKKLNNQLKFLDTEDPTIDDEMTTLTIERAVASMWKVIRYIWLVIMSFDLTTIRTKGWRGMDFHEKVHLSAALLKISVSSWAIVTILLQPFGLTPFQAIDTIITTITAKRHITQDSIIDMRLFWVLIFTCTTGLYSLMWTSKNLSTRGLRNT